MCPRARSSTMVEISADLIGNSDGFAERVVKGCSRDSFSFVVIRCFSVPRFPSQQSALFHIIISSLEQIWYTIAGIGLIISNCCDHLCFKNCKHNTISGIPNPSLKLIPVQSYVLSYSYRTRDFYSAVPRSMPSASVQLWSLTDRPETTLHCRSAYWQNRNGIHLWDEEIYHFSDLPPLESMRCYFVLHYLSDAKECYVCLIIENSTSSRPLIPVSIKTVVNVFFPYLSIEDYSNKFISVWPAGIMITLVKCDHCRTPFLNSYFS